MTNLIVSSEDLQEIGKISYGKMTINNNNEKQLVAIKFLRKASLEEYKNQVVNMGYNFHELLPHGPNYYEAQILD